jgi:hypothetical protein
VPVTICLLPGENYFSTPALAVTYYLSPDGNDTSSGTSMLSPWLTPSHSGLVCGDVIMALPGDYSAQNFDMNHWGIVSCSANNNVVWLKCGSFAACTIADASGHSGLRVDQSYWGVQGWSIGPLSGTGVEGQGSGIIFVASNCASIHHLIAANNVVHDAQAGGIGTYNNGWSGCGRPISEDYIAIVGNIVYNSAQSSGECFSGISIYQPVQTDNLPGTHIYIAGNFSFGNMDPNPCAGTSPTDGEGIILDTFDGSQGTFQTPYAAQADVENNVLVSNGCSGITVFQNSEGSVHSMIYLIRNTLWGNNTDPNQGGMCGDMLLYSTKNTIVYRNVVVTRSTGGCGPLSAFAVYGGVLDASDLVFQNDEYSPYGNSAIAENSPTFVYGNNLSGVNAEFGNPEAPAAPNCSGSQNTVSCMRSVIAAFRISNPIVSGLGFQVPTGHSVHNPLYPSWLCTAEMPSKIDNPGCSK